LASYYIIIGEVHHIRRTLKEHINCQYGLARACPHNWS